MSSKREKIKLQSVESAHCYYTDKNKTQNPDRLERRRYDPTVRKHVLYKEKK